MSDPIRRAIRTMMQVIAGGGAAALFSAVADYGDERGQVLMAGAFVVLISFCQNYLEDDGKIPELMKHE